MATSIVKLPRNPEADYDYLAFSFNGYHSYEDLKIVRTSNGNRYDNQLAPTMKDKTAEVPGADGVYYFGTNYTQKQFNIDFAFDNLYEEDIRKIKNTFSGKELHDLWFAETPYKVYTAKVTGQPNLKYICFEVDGKRIYKGEGNVQFTAYWPYAHTPDYIEVPNFIWNSNEIFFSEEIVTKHLCVKSPISKDKYKGKIIAYYKGEWIGEESNSTEINFDDIVSIDKIEVYIATEGGQYAEPNGQKLLIETVLLTDDFPLKAGDYKTVYDRRNGKLLDNYSAFGNKSEWEFASGMRESGSVCTGENPGELPTYFVLSYNNAIGSEMEFKVGELSIKVDGTDNPIHNLQWDSKTGIVSVLVDNKRVPIYYTGDSLGTIPVGGLPSEDININDATLNYHYWYY